jgi:hypothetical protein
LFKEFDESVDLHACEVCGQQTTAPGRCAFCRMWDIVSASQAVIPLDEIRKASDILSEDVETRVAETVDISGL